MATCHKFAGTWKYAVVLRGRPSPSAGWMDVYMRWSRYIPVVGRPYLVPKLEQLLGEVLELLAVGEELLGSLGGCELVPFHVPELGAVAVVRPQREVLRQVVLWLRGAKHARDVEHLGRRAQSLGGIPLQALPHPAEPPVLVEMHAGVRRRRLNEPRTRLQLGQGHGRSRRRSIYRSLH
jgi:hypothetical protein